MSHVYFSENHILEQEMDKCIEKLRKEPSYWRFVQEYFDTGEWDLDWLEIIVAEVLNIKLTAENIIYIERAIYSDTEEVKKGLDSWIEDEDEKNWILQNT